MEFSPQHRQSTVRGRCCVINCESRRDKNVNLSFHKVPKQNSGTISRINIFGNTELVNKRAEWLRQLNIKDDNRELFVCSLHFNAKDYYLPDMPAQKRILRKDAIPMPVNISNHKKAVNKRRQDRAEQRHLKKEKTKQRNIRKKKNKNVKQKVQNLIDKISDANICTQKEALQDNMSDSKLCTSDAHEIEPEYHDADCEFYSDILHQQSEESNVIDEPVTFSSDNIMKNTENVVVIKYETGVSTNNNKVESQGSVEKKYEDKSVQVSSGDLNFSCSSFITSEENLISMCNIKSFAILDELTKLIDETFPKKKKRLLSTCDSIILTTAKLKLDIPFKALGVLFNLFCDVTIRNIFYDTVKKLAAVLQSTISRVSKEEIQRNMPKCFSKFCATTSVLDCTEIKIQKPKCLKCRIKLYSYYKDDVTVKFMTEVTPGGIITYVSESFGGRTSDKSIFNQSGILQHLQSTRDAVMVDKGFLIDEECMQRRIKLIRLPFLRKREQLLEEEALQNREIASARVHIEQMNQRIKLFQILNNKVPWYFINYIDDIFIICCGLINLSTSIFADDKF